MCTLARESLGFTLTRECFATQSDEIVRHTVGLWRQNSLSLSFHSVRETTESLTITRSLCLCEPVRTKSWQVCISVSTNLHPSPNHPQTPTIHPSPKPSALIFPPPVYRPAPELLPLLQHNHMPQLLLIDRIHIPARLDTHPAPRSPRRHAIHLGYIDPPARVELERGLGTQRFEMDFRARVVERNHPLHRLLAGVDFDRRGVGVEDEAVVWVRLFGSQGEVLVGGHAGEGLDGARGDIVGVGDLVQVGGEVDDGPLQRRAVGDVEVAAKDNPVNRSLSWQAARDTRETYLWFVTPTTVSPTSSPTNSTSYSISKLVFSTPPSFSTPMKYHNLNSTVPGYPSSPSLLRYFHNIASRPPLSTVSGPSKSFFPHPSFPPCKLFGPLLAARS